MEVSTASVVEQQVVHGGYHVLELDAPGIAPLVRPGQFVHVRIPHMEEALLRRPFSVYRTEGPRLLILYKDVGKGTRTMTGLQPGDVLSLIGPLGNGYPEPAAGHEPVLVAGGYGMAALYLLARALPAPGVAFFGGRAACDILCVAEFEALGWNVQVATEDGSLGYRGRVTGLLDRWWEQRTAAPPVEAYACGPNAMLRAVADRAIERDWRAWVSVDRHMGCGVGACLTCVLRVRTADGGWAWQRACKDGPVFECRQVCWELEEEA
jgi:dihydroorotate dehydrogenase electron transfer subunit